MPRRHLAPLGLLLLSTVAAAQAPMQYPSDGRGRDDGRRGGRVDPCQGPLPTAQREEFSNTIPGGSWRISYEPDPSRQTMFRVVAPDGYGVRIEDTGREVLRDTIPVAIEAVGAHFYRVEIFTPQAVLFDKKFEAKTGTVATLALSLGTQPVYPPQPPPMPTPVVQPAPMPTPGPVVPLPVNPMPVTPQPVVPQPQPVAPVAVSPCMPEGDFRGLLSAVQREAFGRTKLRVLEDGMRSRTICIDQVITMVNQFTFSNEKISALKAMAPKVTDRGESYRVYSALTFESDKRQARQILEGK